MEIVPVKKESQQTFPMLSSSSEAEISQLPCSPEWVEMHIACGILNPSQTGQKAGFFLTSMDCPVTQCTQSNVYRNNILTLH